MRRRTKYIALATAILLLGVGAAVIVRRALQVPWFPYMGRPLPDDARRELAHDGWNFASLPVGGGVVLTGLERRTQNPTAPWVVFYGGNSPDFLREGVRFVDSLLDGRDWGASVWAYRGYD